MIAPEVAWDKLRSFQTADELREYFVGESVKGLRASATSCPIAVWMTEQTAQRTTVAAVIQVMDNEDAPLDWPTGHVLFNHTDATYAFMYNFDRAHYPELDVAAFAAKAFFPNE